MNIDQKSSLRKRLAEHRRNSRKTKKAEEIGDKQITSDSLRAAVFTQKPPVSSQTQGEDLKGCQITLPSSPMEQLRVEPMVAADSGLNMCYNDSIKEEVFTLRNTPVVPREAFEKSKSNISAIPKSMVRNKPEKVVKEKLGQKVSEAVFFSGF